MGFITPPGVLPVRSDSWAFITPAQVNLSRWSGGRRVQLLPGARVACELDFRPLVDGSDARIWRSFLASLEGTANTFPVYPEPTDQVTGITGTGDGVVSGAGQTGYSLNVSVGIAFNGITPLSAGMWLGVVLPTKGTQLLLVTSCGAVGATTTGVFNVAFKPILREAPADGATVYLKKPYAVMASPDLEQGFKRDIMLTHSMKIKAEEVW